MPLLEVTSEARWSCVSLHPVSFSFPTSGVEQEEAAARTNRDLFLGPVTPCLPGREPPAATLFVAFSSLKSLAKMTGKPEALLFFIPSKPWSAQWYMALWSHLVFHRVLCVVCNSAALQFSMWLFRTKTKKIPFWCAKIILFINAIPKLLYLQGIRSLPSNLQLPTKIFDILIFHLLRANMFGDLGSLVLFEITPNLQRYSFRISGITGVTLWLLFHNKKWQQ